MSGAYSDASLTPYRYSYDTLSLSSSPAGSPATVPNLVIWCLSLANKVMHVCGVASAVQSLACPVETKWSGQGFWFGAGT